MGHDIKKLREADVNAVAKRLVKQDAPCTAELGSLMDCMKRSGTDADSLCARERAALAACAGRQGHLANAAAVEKRQLVRSFRTLVSTWKRFGY